MKHLSLEQVCNGIAATVALLPEATLQPIPSSSALRVSKKLRFGQHFPYSWVDLFPLVPNEVMQLSAGEHQDLLRVAAGREHVQLVTYWDGRFRALPVSHLHFQGTFPALLRPRQFQNPLVETLDSLLGLSE